ncbi:Protein TIPIN -like protein [Toxocara canis]|uniref:TIMELESS-interacting protein n=1 Tax=Toxocara canis TaxID=6265 RepID=A0A0B2V4V3_TOXCA|nr:Protein TIPIN -like protein [Toxocara canis]
MEEAEDFIAESVFGDRDDNGPILDDENAAPSDEQLLNDLFKKGDKIRVTPKRKVVHPQPKLREQELCGPKGFMALKKMFDNYKPNPRKDPYGNLVDIMNRVEYWAHLLYPKLNFDDFIARVETLGEKRMVKTYMEKMRLNMPLTDEDFTRISKQGVSTFGERDDEMASEPDAGGIITSHPDNDLDDFVDQFYNDPTSMAIASSSKETANAVSGRPSQRLRSHEICEERKCAGSG